MKKKSHMFQTQIATNIEFQMGKMELSKSGLVITQIDTLQFNMDKFSPTRGGKFHSITKWVTDKKACIKIQNEDNQCFKYSVQCGICKDYVKNHPNRLYNYKLLCFE